MSRSKIIKSNGQPKNEKGSYVLVMEVDKAQSIKIGEFGTFDFKKGFFAYVGSAFGAGGVKARTAYHLQRGKKRPHWHVDYLREYSDIPEIWSLHSNRAAEHDIAQLLAHMDGATVPVPGCGSQDCEAGCPAHLFFLAKRPRASSLRAALHRQFPQHGPLFVTKTVAQADYLLGKQYLDERRKAALLDGSDQIAITGSSLTTFSKDPIGRRIVKRLAGEMRIPMPILKELAKFAEAVEQIKTNCDELAPDVKTLDVMLSEEKPQEKAAIRSLSDTSPERQRYRILEVADGRASTIAPRSEDTTVAGIFDTNDFSEVLNRLERARGSILKSLWLLENDIESSMTTVTARDIFSRVAGCKRHAGELAELLKVSVELSGEEWRLDCQNPGKLKLPQVPGQLKSARTLIGKNVSDVPRMSPDKQPTPEKRSCARDEIIKIIAGSDAICALLNAKVRGDAA